MATKDTAASGQDRQQTAAATQALTTSTAARKASEQREVNSSGFYCYIGPGIRGLIQTGAVYRGTREDALKAAAAAIEAQPLVKNLIVSGDALPSARTRARTPGNALYASCRKLAGKE